MNDRPRVHHVGLDEQGRKDAAGDELIYLRGEVTSLRSQRLRQGDRIAELEEAIKRLRNEDQRRTNRDAWIKDLHRRIASLETRCTELMRMNGRLLRTLTDAERKELYPRQVREQKAQVWDEGFEAGATFREASGYVGPNGPSDPPANPYVEPFRG